MSKEKQKPVWRMNAGNGVPSDFCGAVAFSDSTIRNSIPLSWVDPFYWQVFDDPDSLYFSAYQTTRTKAAKYKRKDCFTCFNRARYADITDKSGCLDCNGKGYRLEAI